MPGEVWIKHRNEYTFLERLIFGIPFPRFFAEVDIFLRTPIGPLPMPIFAISAIEDLILGLGSWIFIIEGRSTRWQYVVEMERDDRTKVNGLGYAEVKVSGMQMGWLR